MNPIGEHTESKILSKNEMDFIDMNLSFFLKWQSNDPAVRNKVEQLIDGFMWLNRNAPLSHFGDKKYSITICNSDNNSLKLIDQNSFMFDIYFTNPFCRVRVNYIKAYNGDWMWDYTDQYEWDEDEDNV